MATFDAVNVLPAPAAAKLRRLREHADDLNGAAMTARSHLEDLRTRRNLARINLVEYRKQPRIIEERLESLEAEVAASGEEFNRRNQLFQERSARWSGISRLVGLCETYVADLPRGSRIEVHSQPKPLLARFGGKRAAPSSPRDVIETTRAEIAALKERLTTIDAAPLPASELTPQIERMVDGLAVAPELDDLVVGGREIAWPTRMQFTGSGAFHTADPVALLCWLFPGEVKDRLLGELEKIASGDDAIATSDKPALVAGVREQLLILERSEEAAIAELEASGIEFERRPEADPRAVLSINGPAPRD
jgi:hypothetical protein